ncbi:MAG TPA: ethylbenzene dehydrogenase-related protein [Candidatus Binatia bacterium]|nr:ethylbenzene dehydrogenase-related protein [Candidatus Binatia bacterium]
MSSPTDPTEREPRSCAILNLRPTISALKILHFVQDDIGNAGLLLAAAVVFALAFAGCSKQGPPISEAEVKAIFDKTLPSTVDDAMWERAPVHTAKLIPQDMVEPRLMRASTPFVNVQSITDGRQMAFRLSWSDATMDDIPGQGRFGDAVAVQLPATTAPDAPAPQMGEEGKPVEITYWSAVFQAAVNGRKDDIHALYPRAKVDHYPFEAPSLKPGSTEQQAMAKRYAPARSLENPMAGPRTVPVQDLVAAGPGTLQPAEKTVSLGSGTYVKSGWSVVLIRPLPNGTQLGGRTQVAFAVWEGSHQEVGARKMRTPWIPLTLESAR